MTYLKLQLERIWALPQLPQVQTVLAFLRQEYLALFTPRLSLKEQMFFSRRLAFLITSGVPLIDGLHILRAQAKGSQCRLLDHVIVDISNGQSLSKSFGKFPRVFGGFMISILKVGEESGTLSICLNYLAEELKKRQMLSRKVISAFIYPAVITAATVAITAFLMLYLFPKIMPIFISLHMELPLTTRIVMASSIFMQHWGLYVLVGFVLGVLGLGVVLRRSAEAHLYFDHIIVRIPVFGSVVRFYNTANITRTLGLLLRSGVKLSSALPIVANTTKNLVYRKELIALSSVVERGERISTHIIEKPAYFPVMVGHMLAVGEKSGTLSDTLSYLAELYEQEVDEFTKNISTLIEPALMIVMGIIVGFVAVSIITPIYGITQHLNP